MSIKILKFNSPLHKISVLSTTTKQIVDDIEKRLNTKLIFTNDASDYDCNLKLIYVESGGSEGYFIKEFKKMKEPYILLTSGENNSLAASLEILTYLNLHHKKGEIIHGDIDYVAKRIKELMLINNIKKELAQQRFGVIGNPSDWLISSIPNLEDVKKKLGIKFIPIPIQEVVELANNAPSKYGLDIYGNFDKQELKKADNVYHALNIIKNKYHLTGLTTRCFDLLPLLKTTACLALANLNDKNIIATCEGDVTAMISMKIASLIGDGYTFQANPSFIDVKNKSMIIAHCTIPTKMLTSYKLDTHFESNIGVAIKGELKEKKVTVFRMSSNLKDYFVATGKIIRNLYKDNLCRTQIEIQFDDNIDSLLIKPCGNHHIIFYGDYKKEIDILMKELL